MFVWPEPRPPTPAEFLEHAEGADAIVTMVTDRVDDAVLERCPSLRVVANVAAGYDNFDVPALTRRRIPAGNTPDVLTNSTADMAFALLLASARRVVEGRDAVLAGEWTVWDPALMLGLELAGSTLGIVGMGRIGQAVAKRALAFSMRVIATSRTERPVEGVTYVDLETLLRESDVVSLHVALSEATRHLIGVDELAAMKPSAILINTARGAVVDQVALGRRAHERHDRRRRPRRLRTRAARSRRPDPVGAELHRRPAYRRLDVRHAKRDGASRSRQRHRRTLRRAAPALHQSRGLRQLSPVATSLAASGSKQGGEGLL